MTSGGLLERPESGPAIDHLDRVKAEQEGGHDAEVAAAAAHAPRRGPRSRSLLAVTRRPSASTTSAASRLSMVRPYLRRQVADAAAQRQPADAGRGDDAGRHGHAEGMRGVIHVAPCAAAVRRDGVRRRVDSNALHPRQVDDQPVVTDSRPPPLWPPPRIADKHPVFAGKVDCCDDIRHVSTRDDETRPLVDHRVVNFAGRVICLIRGLDELTANTTSKLVSRHSGHSCPPLVTMARGHPIPLQLLTPVLY